jgi:hypothetical protein
VFEFGFQLDSILYTVRLLFHERFLAALPGMHWFKWTYFHERFLAALPGLHWFKLTYFHERFLAALPGMHWFKWTYFHDRALLFPQRCCQGHGDAIAASRGDQRNPRDWQRRFCAALLGSGRRWGER